MHKISLAPVLSATRRRDSCWITSCSSNLGRQPGRIGEPAVRDPHADSRWRAPPAVRARVPGCGTPRGRASRPEYLALSRPVQPTGSLGLLDDGDQTPPLGGGQRPGLHDLDAVADAGDVLLVVRLQLAGAPDDLAVQAVLHTVLDLDDDGLLHLVAHHEALTDLAVAPAGQARAARGRFVGGRRLGLAHATPSLGATERPSSRSRMIV